MLKLDYLKELLLLSIALSTITCAIIQKTKSCFKTSKYICIYSFVVNIVIGIIFCITFTKINFPNSLWIGLFSFIGADTIYKSLEGKLLSYSDITGKKIIESNNEEDLNRNKDVI